MFYYTNFILVGMSNHTSFAIVQHSTDTSYVIVTDHASAALKQDNMEIIICNAQFDFVLTFSDITQILSL